MDYPKLIAHRGLHGGNIPENSLSAFRKAAERGFAVELDVRLTKDCKIVVFHDENIKRMTGIDASLSFFTYEQLQAFSLEDSGERIPLLSQVLKEIDGRVPIFIEIKDGSPIGVLEKRLNRLMKGYGGEWAVMSFNPLRMLWFRLFSKSVVRGQLVSTFKSGFSLSYLFRLISSKPEIWRLISRPDFISYDLRCIDLGAVMSAFENGSEFLTWTANSEELLSEALKFSRSVTFENISPERARELAEETE